MKMGAEDRFEVVPRPELTTAQYHELRSAIEHLGSGAVVVDSQAELNSPEVAVYVVGGLPQRSAKSLATAFAQYLDLGAPLLTATTMKLMAAPEEVPGGTTSIADLPELPGGGVVDAEAGEEIRAAEEPEERFAASHISDHIADAELLNALAKRLNHRRALLSEALREPAEAELLTELPLPTKEDLERREEMVLRMARAIHGAGSVLKGIVRWDELPDDLQDDYVTKARAALMAAGHIPDVEPLTPQEAHTLHAVYSGDAFDAEHLETAQPKLEAIAGEDWR